MYNMLDSKKNTGYSQCEEKIRFLTESLASEAEIKMKISYEYPTMYVTNTQKIFLTRLKRLKHQRATQISSQPSLQQSQNHKSSKPKDKSSDSSSYPKYLTKSGLQDSLKKSQNFELLSESNNNNSDVVSYESQIFDIFQGKAQIIVEAQFNFKNNKEEDLNNLICDFNDDSRQANDTKKKSSVHKFEEQLEKSIKRRSKNRFMSPEDEQRLDKIHRKYKKEAFKDYLAEGKLSPRNQKAQNQESLKNLKLMKKRRIQEKAHELLRKINNEEQFEFSKHTFQDL